MSLTKIESALVSVYHKEGLDHIINLFKDYNIKIYSTGGTKSYLETKGAEVHAVEDITSYPSILDGRVKTLHPKVFGGILARREKSHLAQLVEYDIPSIDLVIVDLYPFEKTVAETDDESQIIEKIDIGGISLIRAAAKNYKDVLVVPSQEQYGLLAELLEEKQGFSSIEDRKLFAHYGFAVSAHYDTKIQQYFASKTKENLGFFQSERKQQSLRYGENPHQTGAFYGDLSELFKKLSGKALSYNNLVDIDAAVQLMAEFKDEKPCVAILKHTNPCGLAIRKTMVEAWKAALAGDPISAFGGILIANHEIDLATAQEIDKIFYEVLVAPSFSQEAFDFLSKKKKRVLLQLNNWPSNHNQYKSILNGVIVQDIDHIKESRHDLIPVTKVKPTSEQLDDLLFAVRCVKHLKSNAIALAFNNQLVGMGCGQTSRVDALNQAIAKANHFELPLEGAVMASDAFFPFADCVEISHEAGIQAVVQPGGSIRDQDSIDYCNQHDLAMVTTGVRHFKH